MSGICGIVTFGAARPDRTELEPVLEPLKRRGPDGAAIWTHEGVALGHALLATTPEATVEKLPLNHGASGCTITADVRLDNRDELLAALAMVNTGRIIGDGELILLAYLKWGDDCVHHLLGDFAFAIWDSRARRLLCGRDPMGMRQLAYFHRPRAPFVFATEPAAVLRHPSVPKDLNPGRIADFLDRLGGFDLSATFYSAVARLPAAHVLTLDGDQLRLRKYWRLRTPPPLRLRSEEDYSDAFLSVFRTAVGCRLRTPDRVGAMLSGGLDSSSVAAVAAELLAKKGEGPLPTFSAVGPDPMGCVETRAIHAASQIEGVEPHLICFADLERYRDELIRLTKEEAEPFEGELGLPRTMYLAAHREGLKIVLDGVAGDLVLNSDSHIARLLRNGRILQAWNEAKSERQIWGRDWPAWKAFGMGASRAWVPRSLRGARRRMFWWWNDRQIGRSGLISREFAALSKLRQRRRTLRARDSMFDRIDDEERARRVEHANLIIGRERYDSVASSVAIEPRDPFVDLRLIDFCLSLPWDRLQSGGWTKALLRRSMAGRLPDAVRWRKGKEHLGWAFNAEIFGRLAARDLSSRRFRETIAPYVNLGRFEGGSSSSSRADHCQDSVDALCLFYWLDSAQGLRDGGDVND
jgi:asparagine synthase (glutamine-hydrolysing)